jgi:hypothetical protein
VSTQKDRISKLTAIFKHKCFIHCERFKWNAPTGFTQIHTHIEITPNTIDTVTKDLCSFHYKNHLDGMVLCHGTFSRMTWIDELSLRHIYYVDCNLHASCEYCHVGVQVRIHLCKLSGRFGYSNLPGKDPIFPQKCSANRVSDSKGDVFICMKDYRARRKTVINQSVIKSINLIFPQKGSARP